LAFLHIAKVSEETIITLVEITAKIPSTIATTVQGELHANEAKMAGLLEEGQ
jgi:hypothetical protein